MAENAKNAGDGQRRRYRNLFVVEAALLAVSAAVLALPGFLGRWGLAPVVVILIPLCLWHVVAVPICFFYLIGNPIVMSLRSNATAESTAFRGEVKKRPALSDNEFYSRFYRDSNLPEDIPARVRSLLREFDSLSDRLVPADRVYLLLDDDFGMEEAVHLIEEDFGIQFTEADYPSFDGSLGNLIAMVHMRISPAAC